MRISMLQSPALSIARRICNVKGCIFLRTFCNASYWMVNINFVDLAVAHLPLKPRCPTLKTSGCLLSQLAPKPRTAVFPSLTCSHARSSGSGADIDNAYNTRWKDTSHICWWNIRGVRRLIKKQALLWSSVLFMSVWTTVFCYRSHRLYPKINVAHAHFVVTGMGAFFTGSPVRKFTH